MRQISTKKLPSQGRQFSLCALDQGSISSSAMVAGISWAVLTFWSSTTQSKQEMTILPFQTHGSPGSSRPPSQPVQSGDWAMRVILPSGDILPMALAEKSAT